jgi:hypothetical protein
MLGPSEKSVPGCLVSIVPTLIGVPVAATPGFGPHDEVSTLELLELLEPELAAAPLLLDELLLPHPTRTSIPDTAASTTISRVRGHSWNFLTSLSSSSDEGTPAPVRPGWGGMLWACSLACN